LKNYVIAVGTTLAVLACHEKHADRRVELVDAFAPAESNSGTSAAEVMKDQPAVHGAPVVKIWVARDGAIELNGAPSALPDVERVLASAAGGTVFYGRDVAAQDPHPNAMKVIELVVRNRLPIRMSTKHDFSDVVDTAGRSKPK
jgi:hypothetical protein